MTTTIYYVRHGQTRSNITKHYMGWSAEDMDDTGYEQVHRLSDRLARIPLSAIYTSPLRRTLSTAEIIAKPHRLKPEIVEDIAEIRTGDWQGLHSDEIKRRWPELWRQSRIDPSGITLPNGESFKQITERAVRAFKRMAEANAGKQMVVVTHDVVIRVTAAYVLGVSNSIYRRLEINNASITTMWINEGNLKLITLNDVAHLEV